MERLAHVRVNTSMNLHIYLMADRAFGFSKEVLGFISKGLHNDILNTFTGYDLQITKKYREDGTLHYTLRCFDFDKVNQVKDLIDTICEKNSVPQLGILVSKKEPKSIIEQQANQMIR